MSMDSGKTQQSMANMNSSSSQDVWGTQSPFLEQLYQQGADLASQPDYSQQQGIQAGNQFAGQVTGDLYDPLAGQYQQAFGENNPFAQAAQGAVDPMLSGLSRIATQDPGQGSNPLLDKNIAMALEQSSQNFLRNVAPGISRAGTEAGQYGTGTREQIALGNAMSDYNRDALASAMGAYSDQYGRDLQSKSLMDQNALAASQQLGGLLGGYSQNLGQGAQLGSQLMNLGMGSSNIYSDMSRRRFDPIYEQQGILGGPLVLGETTSTGTSRTDPMINSGNAGLAGTLMGFDL